MVIPLFDCCLFTQKTAGSTKGEIHEGIQCLDSTVQTTMYNQRALMNSQSTEARHGRHMLIPKNSKRTEWSWRDSPIGCWEGTPGQVCRAFAVRGR